MAEAARAYTRVFIHLSGMACCRCVRFSSAPIPGADLAGASPCYRCVCVCVCVCWLGTEMMLLSAASAVSAIICKAWRRHCRRFTRK